MKKVIFGLVLTVVAFCGIMFGGCKDGEEKAQVETKKVMIVTEDSCTITLDFPAQLRGKQDIEILPQVEAQLNQLLVKEGDKVKKGAKMFVLDQTEFLSRLNAAKAATQMAHAQLETAKVKEEAKRELLRKNIISQNEYKVAQNELLTAKAALAQAQATENAARNDFNHTIICAPSNGVVGNINHRQGSLVGPMMQTPLTVVSDNSMIYAYISISEASYLTMMNEYGSKEAVMAELPKSALILGNGERYDKEGTIETFSGIVDQNTGAISVRIAYENPNGILAAGGSATVECPLEIDSAIIIPRTATYEIQDKVYAYRVIEAKGKYTAESTIIEVVRLDEQNYIVVDGLKKGDMIVTEGVRKMVNGQEIKIEKK